MKEITEIQIVKIFFATIVRDVNDAWDEIYKELNETFKLTISDEDSAKMELTFAITGIEIQALKNLFPERFNSIYNKIINLEKEPIFKDKIDLYNKKFNESIEQYTKNKYYSPLEFVAEQLVRDWTGNDINKFFVKNTTVVNPVLTMMISSILFQFTGLWKNVKDTYIIIND